MLDKKTLGEFIYKLDAANTFLRKTSLWSAPVKGFSYDNSLPAKYMEALKKETWFKDNPEDVICILGDWESVAEGIVFTDKTVYLSSPKNSEKKFKVSYKEITSLNYNKDVPKLTIITPKKNYTIDTNIWSKLNIYAFLQFASENDAFPNTNKEKLNEIIVGQESAGAIVAYIMNSVGDHVVADCKINKRTQESIILEEQQKSPQKGFVDCGKDVYDVFAIESVEIRKVTDWELESFEYEKNGERIYSEDVFSPTLLSRINEVLIDFKNDIGKRLPEPKLEDDDLDGYKSDYKYLEKIENWGMRGTGKFRVFSHGFDIDGNLSILWEFNIYKKTASASEDTITPTVRFISIQNLIPIFEELINLPKPKNGLESFFVDYSYKDIQEKLRPVYDEYIKGKKTLDKRNKLKESFMDVHKNKFLLCITFREKNGTVKYLEDYCGFDIFKKESEILNIMSKLKNSNNAGEKIVEHSIKWFTAAYDGYVVTIKNDCENKYRYNCINLYKPEIIDEPQEYDHILVCSAGVVLIETKHWKGTIEIRSDGKWLRKESDEDPVKGVENPKLQMRRHEVLMQKIVPNVSVHSLLCFSNASVIINGKENFKDYPVITVDQLEETLTGLCSEGNYTKEDIEYIVDTIDAHKIYKI